MLLLKSVVIDTYLQIAMYRVHRGLILGANVRALTAAELDIGIRVLKNGKAPGLDDIQTELIKQFGRKARDWLLRLSTTVPRIRKFRSSVDRLR